MCIYQIKKTEYGVYMRQPKDRILHYSKCYWDVGVHGNWFSLNFLCFQRTTEVTNAEDAVAPLEEGMSVDLDFRYLTPPPEQEQEEVMVGWMDGWIGSFVGI